MSYQNLKAEMARNGLNSEAVAKVAGVTARTVQNWLKGESEPSISQGLSVMALFEDCSAEYLFEK